MTEELITPVALAATVLILGLLVAWIAWRALKIESGTTVAALIFLPVVVVLLFTGRISEISAFGVSAQLHEASEAPVGGDAVAAPSAADGTNWGASEAGLVRSEVILGTAAPEHDVDRLAFWQEAVHVIAVRPQDWPTEIPFRDAEVRKKLDAAKSLASIIYHSLLAGSFYGLVILDEKDRPLGFFKASFFLDLLRVPIDVSAPFGDFKEHAPTQPELEAALLQSELWAILLNPAGRAERSDNQATIYGGVSRLEALQMMNEARFEVLVVIDQQGRYAGIVAKKDLIADFVVDIATAIGTPN